MTKDYSKHESFFNVFSYSHMMHDAIDYGLTYEEITITQDIVTSLGLVLKKGDKYETCYMKFLRHSHDGSKIINQPYFHFCNWKPGEIEPHTSSSYNTPSSIIILMSELAPFLHWNEKKFPANKTWVMSGQDANKISPNNIPRYFEHPKVDKTSSPDFNVAKDWCINSDLAEHSYADMTPHSWAKYSTIFENILNENLNELKGPATNIAVNDHICTSCGNEKCSKIEKSCWRCGTEIKN